MLNTEPSAGGRSPRSHNFLLASWGTSGNLNPLLTAARQLRRRGHAVRILADPAMRGEVEAADFNFLTWRRGPTGSVADPTDFSDLADWTRKTLFHPAVDYALDIQEEIGRTRTDALLCVDVLIGAALGAEVAGIPVAMLSPHVSLRPLPGVPPISSGLTQSGGLQQREAIAAANRDWALFLNSFLPLLNAARTRLGLSALAEVLALFDRQDRILLAISRAFDFEAESLPDNVRYLGPLLDQPSWSKPWASPWSASVGRPRALVTCSTGAQGQGELFQRILNAMGRVELDAVATAGPNLDVAGLRAPPNVRLLHSAPHDAVMKEVSLVVTQGGHGTVNRALVNGLPLLVLPLGRDQFDNAVRVEAKGAGLRLPPTASEAEIAAAADRLIREPQFRAAASRLGEAIRAEVAQSLLVHEMEAIAASGRREDHALTAGAAR